MTTQFDSLPRFWPNPETGQLEEVRPQSGSSAPYLLDL